MPRAASTGSARTDVVAQGQASTGSPRTERLAGAAGSSLRADVLLVPHHGSKTSSSDAFLSAVKPRIAIVQAGYRNRFGHPAASVLARYAEHGVRVAQSAQCGAAWWRSTEPAALQCQRALAFRYWNHRME
jgi:competence protein ComEC